MKTIKFLVGVVALSTLVASACWAGAPVPAKPPETVLALMKTKKELSAFAEMIVSSGVADNLTKKDILVTVFAPTNSAMGKIPSNVLKRIKADKDDQKKFVLYHTILGSQVQSGNIMHRRAGAGAGDGGMIAFDGLGKDLKVNESKIVLPDLAAQNGVVHEIDAPLIPPALLEKPVDKKEQEAKKMEMEKIQAERQKENEERLERQKAAEDAATVPDNKASFSSFGLSLWDKVKSWWK